MVNMEFQVGGFITRTSYEAETVKSICLSLKDNGFVPCAGTKKDFSGRRAVMCSKLDDKVRVLISEGKW